MAIVELFFFVSLHLFHTSAVELLVVDFVKLVLSNWFVRVKRCLDVAYYSCFDVGDNACEKIGHH